MIKQVEISEIPKLKHNRKVLNDIEQFLNSDWDACEVNISEYKHPDSARQIYSTMSRREGYKIKTTIKNGKLYLIKTDKI